MIKKNIGGLFVDSITKQELLHEIRHRMSSGQKTFVITPYSEFLYHSLHDSAVRDVLNRADFSVPDGIGLFVASKFLGMPVTAKTHMGKILQTVWHIIRCTAAVLLCPRYVRGEFQEKIPGSDLVWDLAELAAKNNFSLYLLGGFGNTPRQVAEQLAAKNPGLRIAGHSAKNPDDQSVLSDIQQTKPDIIFVAYGPLTQEFWIINHMQDLPAKLYIGLGGTFDYIAGKKPTPPQIIRKFGLEWLYRLLTQPYRYKRIFNAVFGLISALLRFKIYESYPYRKNVVSIILNEKNEIFIARYNSNKSSVRSLGRTPSDFENYWQFPQGGAEENESTEQTSRREVKEETGMHSLEIIKISDFVNTYSWKRTASRPLFVSKRFQYRGQQQQIVYLRFTGPENEIVLDQDEFLQYQWVPLQKLQDSVHPDKKILADQVLKDLSYLP